MQETAVHMWFTAIQNYILYVGTTSSVFKRPKFDFTYHYECKESSNKLEICRFHGSVVFSDVPVKSGRYIPLLVL